MNYKITRDSELLYGNEARTPQGVCPEHGPQIMNCLRKSGSCPGVESQLANIARQFGSTL